MQERHGTSSSVAVSLARVRAWLASADRPRAQIAAEAGVDEKTVRLAGSPTWNPTAKTLQRLEAIIPRTWQPSAKKRAARAA